MDTPIVFVFSRLFEYGFQSSPLFLYLVSMLNLLAIVPGMLIFWAKMNHESKSDTPDKSACGLPSEASLQDKGEVSLSEGEWRQRLSPEQFRVLRQQGTEAPFNNEYWNSKVNGDYVCTGCGKTLFSSDNKYDSGTGWPSFSAPVRKDAIGEERDESHGMVRIEVHCSHCGGHLGHVFPDGPEPTGLRYCINSASLLLKPRA